MQKFNINHYSTYSNLKASVCERFNRTLKTNMWREFNHQGSHNWLKILQQLLYNYNHKVHRTIHMRPVDVTKKFEKHLLQTVYSHIKISYKGKYKVGDFVRISKHKHIFQKGYEPNWSTEIFIIDKVQLTNPVTYKLKDLHNNSIEGGFYEFELQKTTHSNVYLVEKILRKKGSQVYVKWLGFNNTHNSWVDKSNIILK